MLTADSGLLSEAVVPEKEEVKEEIDSLQNRGAKDEEKKEHYNYPQPRSNTTESNTTGPVPAVKEDLEKGVPTQFLGQRSRFQDLPEDLAEELDRILRDIESEDQLEAALEAALKNLGLSDEPIVLGDDGKAYYYMPGDQHNEATGLIARNFTLWAQDLKGIARKNTNIKLGPRLPGAPPPRKRRKPKTRLPDVALWGRSKCELKNGGKVSKPQRINPASAQPVVHPHVVIQVSNFNDEDYEVDAINDLATRAVAGQGTQPRLGVLIKDREADPPGVQAGFDIYYLPNGTYMSDALNGTNGARHVVYHHTGPDVLVTITEADLGGIDLSFWQSIKDFLLGSSRDFQLSMAELYGVMV